MKPRLTVVVLALVASAILALVVTAFVSWLLVKVGVIGLTHTVAVMLVMPLAFAAAALLLARKVLLRDRA